MKIRKLLAIWAAKAAGAGCKMMGRQGVTWAGKIALKIYPQILTELSKEVRKGIFVVCGTNGKTTTNNMLCAALEAEGQKVVCNHTGSNMLNGVVAAFALGAGLNGHIDADYACIEVDEASTRHIFPRMKPNYMVMTNLFRDQLDRYGEIDITMNILEEMICTVPDMKLIVNGDDALSAYMAMDSGNPCVYYGISRPVMKNETNEIREGRFCKKCGERLQYSFYHYSQLGDYQCPRCGFKRPVPDYDAEDVKVSDQLSFSVEGNRIVANYRGFYNVYNILAAYAGIRTAGFKAEHFMDMLKNFNPENGRMEQFRIKGAGDQLPVTVDIRIVRFCSIRSISACCRWIITRRLRGTAILPCRSIPGRRIPGRRIPAGIGCISTDIIPADIRRRRVCAQLLADFNLHRFQLCALFVRQLLCHEDI
mgnify:CR=1 FL=1